jgi:predicted permease
MIAILSNFLASSRSVGTAATMAGAGIYLHRLGLANDESKKLLAKISQQVTIPALLFTKIVYCKQDSSDEECTSIYDMLGSVWMLLFWPVYVVGCGLLVGYIAARISNTPSHHRPLVLASCAFANSTGLPITLLSVIHQNFPPSTELGKIDATLFLSIYLLMYPVLQWGIGGWLLMTDEKESSYEIEKDQNAIKEETEKHSTKLLVSKSPSSVALGIEYDDLENTTLINTYQEQNTDIVDSTSISTEERPLDFWMQIKKGFEKALQPPVIGSLLGLFVAAIRPLRGVFVDMMNRDDDAYLEWIFDGLYSVSIFTYLADFIYFFR